jgi:hypothetical protein
LLSVVEYHNHHRGDKAREGQLGNIEGAGSRILHHIKISIGSESFALV